MAVDRSTVADNRTGNKPNGHMEKVSASLTFCKCASMTARIGAGGIAGVITSVNYSAISDITLATS